MNNDVYFCFTRAPGGGGKRGGGGGDESAPVVSERTGQEGGSVRQRMGRVHAESYNHQLIGSTKASTLDTCTSQWWRVLIPDRVGRVKDQ
jgi:hypothetical protein